MSSRDSILQAVLHNQPELSPLPDISMFKMATGDIVQKYADMFTTVSGTLVLADKLSSVNDFVKKNFDITKRTITTLPELSDVADLYSPTADPHSFDDVELAIIKSNLAVAENGALWLTESDMGQRIIPYICQHLIVLLDKESIVATMHDAYSKIGIGDYGFGGFIGGPSKTADIEQALVLGAHGPLTMTVVIIDSAK